MLTPEALLLGYLGDDRTLDFYESSVLQLSPLKFQRRPLEADTAHRADLWRVMPQRNSDGFLFRASVPPSRVLDFTRTARPAWWVADAAFGIVLGTCETEADFTPLRTAAGSMGGSIFFRSMQTGALAGVTASNAQRRLLERLKESFDPANQLQPLGELA
jgi:hypothetical protein